MYKKDTMSAARLNVKTKEFAVKEVPIPSPGSGQVLLRVMSAGVCLSDVHLVGGEIAPALLENDEVTLGHEIAGVIESVGDGVHGWSVGERVVIYAGEERATGFHTMGVDFDGGWADFVVANSRMLVRLPDSISFDQACILGDAVGTPWAAITTTANVRPGQSVGVWGLGGLGSHAIQLLRFMGAAPIVAIDPLPAARERALSLGADLALDPSAPDLLEQILTATGGSGLDVALDFAGFPSVQEQGLSALGRNGKLVLVGISGQPFMVEDSLGLTFKKQQILGHYASEPHHLTEIVRLVALGRLDFSTSVSDVLPLSQAADAVERLRNKVGNPVRLVLQP